MQKIKNECIIVVDDVINYNNNPTSYSYTVNRKQFVENCILEVATVVDSLIDLNLKEGILIRLFTLGMDSFSKIHNYLIDNFSVSSRLVERGNSGVFDIIIDNCPMGNVVLTYEDISYIYIPKKSIFRFFEDIELDSMGEDIIQCLDGQRI